MKKLLSIATAVMLIALVATPALAHGGHRGGQQAVSYSVCPTESCTLTGLHTHSGTTYAAHKYGDGHSYHAYCEIEDCILAGYHAHDNEYCFGQPQNAGYGCCQAGRGHC